MSVAVSADFVPTTGSDGELVARAASLRSLIREQAERGSRDGRVTPDVVSALDSNGLLKLTVPTRYGGAEVNTRTLVDVLVELARGDGSTGWSAMLLNIANWFATTWPVRTQEELWGRDPGMRGCMILAPNPTVSARRVEGGFVVSGKWPYASGSFTATYAGLGFLAPQADGTQAHVLGIAQPGEWGLERSWFPIGMRGTGSDTVVLDEAFIPDHRVQGFAQMVVGDYATEFRHDETQARAAFLPKGTIIFGAVQIGMARAAYELTVDRLRHKGVVGTGYTQARHSPVHQVSVAQAIAKIDAAELLAHRSCYDIDSAAIAGTYPDEITRGRVRNDTGQIVCLVHEAVDLLLKASGSSSFVENNPLSRIYQDIGMAGSHVHATPGIALDVYGRLLLGAEGELPVAV